MLLTTHLKNRHLILASGSPRRQQFLKDLGLEFEIRTKEIRETYPAELSGAEIAVYLAKAKAEAYKEELKPGEILITGGTIVCQNDLVFNKPKNKEEAITMLQQLSGKEHQVISSACLSSTEKTVSFYDKTSVFFKDLSITEINFYIDQYQPFDKAGAYGIQEWIGKIGIHRIEGSFYNVMGMPVNKVYKALSEF